MINKKINILIAEDDYFSREMIIEILKMNSLFDVWEAKNGDEALTLLFQNSFDMIILSINLPQKDGFEILKVIQRGRDFASIPTIVLVSNNEEKLKSLELGANIFLEKPYDILELKLKVSNQLKMIENLKNKMIKTFQGRVCELEIEKAQREILMKVVRQNEKQMLFVDNFKSLKIATYTKELSRLSSDIPQYLLQNIYYAASFHNIGFISLPNELKIKRGQYSEKEREIMEKHIKYGIEFVSDFKNTKLLEVAKPIIEQYCERWDGLGYPKGLKGDDISFYARVVSITVYFNALTSPREHRNKYQKIYTNREVYFLIKSQSKKRFDPILVDVLLENFAKFINLKDKILKKIENHN